MLSLRAILVSLTALSSAQQIVISGIIDGPLSGGLPKAVELYVLESVPDLSIFGIGSANNGGGTDGEEFSLSGSATVGDYLYIASESTGFESFFGFTPDFTTTVASINGDDAIELFKDGAVVDVFGEISIDGTGQPWDYMDGWAYRLANTGPDGMTFTLGNWQFSGADALDGETTNAAASTPFPIATYAGTSGSEGVLIITGVVDGPLSGGFPKAIELYVLESAPDLSIFGIGSANNGGGTDGEEFTLSGSATTGDYLYIASESAGFESFFGFTPDFTTTVASINGDDAIELFKDGAVVDVFGEISVDGTGQPWDYVDGWAYRLANTGPDGMAFTLDNWQFSGADALDGETTNAAASTPFPIATYAATASAEGVLIITGVVDGPLSGGFPKAIELYMLESAPDLSVFGIGSANNGGGTDGEEFTLSGSATAGDYLYISSESTGFESFFGFTPDFTTAVASINGDDAIELFKDGIVVDVFGEISVDGTGQPWDYVDGWAYRLANTGPDGMTFTLDNWRFSGADALDGETTNAAASTPFPIATYAAPVGSDGVLIIAGVVDGPLSGGLPKAIELYVLESAPDLSIFGIGSANNGGGTDGEEFTLFGSATTGDYLYIASESTGFESFFGFTPDFTTAVASINGDDAIELFKDGAVVDVFGEISVDGTGQPWDYVDGWAYRLANTGPDGMTFTLGNWQFSGADALDGETTNAAASTPFPIATYAGISGSEGVLIITGVVDGPLSGGFPKAIELYVEESVPDLSVFGIGSANNGGGTDGEEFTLSGSATAGDYLYISSESTGFESFFGFTPDFTTTVASINGDDAIELFKDGAVVDVFGEISVDGTGQPWDYVDGWAYRRSGTGPDGMTFTLGNWRFSGTDALDGELTNAGASTPFPVETYTSEIQPTLRTISEIQGSTEVSPLLNELVRVESVVVTALVGRTYPESGDFFTDFTAIYVQDPIGDGDLSTSDGLRVADAANPNVKVGDIVNIEGTVVESFSETTLDAEGFLIEIVSSNNALPKPVTVSLDSESTAQADKIAFEKFEGMLVRLKPARDSKIYVASSFELDDFGEFKVCAVPRPDDRLFQYTHENLPDQTEFGVFEDTKFLENLRVGCVGINDGASQSFRNVDTVTTFVGGLSELPLRKLDGIIRGGTEIKTAEGILSFSFSQWKLEVATSLKFGRVNRRPELRPKRFKELRVASINVENYFLTLGSRGAETQTQLSLQRDKLIVAMKEINADVYGLSEVENGLVDVTFGEGNVGADIAKLLKDATGRNYKAVTEVYDQAEIGTDAIRCEVIFDADELLPTGFSFLDDTTLRNDVPGGAELFNEDTNIFDNVNSNRNPIAVSFALPKTTIKGDEVTFLIVVNHFKSKGGTGSGVNSDQGNGSGNWDFRRDLAAKAIPLWLETSPTGTNPIFKLITGDLNAYQFEAPIRTLVEAYTPLGDLTDYSFSFQSQFGGLDYIFASTELALCSRRTLKWNINADEPDAYGYLSLAPSLIDPTSPARFSDHDPVISTFRFGRKCQRRLASLA